MARKKSRKQPELPPAAPPPTSQQKRFIGHEYRVQIVAVVLAGVIATTGTCYQLNREDNQDKAEERLLLLKQVRSEVGETLRRTDYAISYIMRTDSFTIRNRRRAANTLVNIAYAADTSGLMLRLRMKRVFSQKVIDAYNRVYEEAGFAYTFINPEGHDFKLFDEEVKYFSGKIPLTGDNRTEDPANMTWIRRRAYLYTFPTRQREYAKELFRMMEQFAAK